MHKQKTSVFAALALMTLPLAAGALTLSVTDVKMAQRYPWNGLVDIDYTVVCDDSDADVYVYPVGYDADFNVSIAPRTLTGDGANGQAVKAGTHRMTWDMATDMGENYNRAKVSMKIHAYAGAAPYLVVDLSAGPNAETWPVSYLTEMPGEEWPIEYKTTKLVLKLVAPGEFMMGSPADEVGRSYKGYNTSAETLHSVVLTQPFYCGIFEMTQSQMKLISGLAKAYDTSSYYSNPAFPAGRTSYNELRGQTVGSGFPIHNQVDADSIIGILRLKTGITFDLPTEAQWEYVCRAGCSSPFNNGTASTNGLSLVGRWSGNTHDYCDGKEFHPYSVVVGSYLPNAWGFYDMHGNVAEWCLDWLTEDLGAVAVTNPVGPSDGTYRVVRGGGYNTIQWYWFNGSEMVRDPKCWPRCRAAARDPNLYNSTYGEWTYPSLSSTAVGFRLVAIPAE